MGAMIVGEVGLVLVGLALWGLPGWALRVLLARLAGGAGGLWTKDGGLGVALESLGLSLALWPILAYYLPPLGLPFAAPLVFAILLISALIGGTDAVLRLRARQRNPRPASPPARTANRLSTALILWGPLVALTTLALVARFVAVQGLHIPLFGDSLHHTVIVQLILDQHGIPTTYRPFAPVDSFTYHFGFHTLAALWSLTTGQPAWGAVIGVGQLLNALAVPAQYYLGRELFRSRLAGLFSAVIIGFLSGMPAYYVNWGRYTQLAGQVLLPFALVWFIRAVERPPRRWALRQGDAPLPAPTTGYQASPVLASGGGEPWKMSAWRAWAARLGLALVGAAGLFFTHYRIQIFYAAFVLAYLAVETLRGSLLYRERLEVARRMPRTYLKNLAGGWLAFVRGLYIRTLILAALGALLVLPWFINLLNNYIQGLLKRLSTVSADYLQSYNNEQFLGQHIGQALPLLAGFGFVLLVGGAGWARRPLPAGRTGGPGHAARAALLVALWAVLMILSAVPGRLGLPGSGAVSTFTVGIALYLPLGALGGAGLAWLLEAAALWLRGRGPRPVRLTRLALVLPLLLAVRLLASNPGALHAPARPQWEYVTDPDLRAMEWITAHTPADSLFLIGSETSYNGRAVTATDAGMWLPLLTARRVTLPPLVTGSEGGQPPDFWPHARLIAEASHATTAPATLALLRAEGVQYVYLGTRRPSNPQATLDLAAMQADPAHFTPVYAQENVYIFALK